MMMPKALVLVLLVLAAFSSASAQVSGGPCQLPGDGETGAPLRYRSQNDGTIKDLNTGLTWELKDSGIGIHSVNRLFMWSSGGASGGAAPDGSAFTEFLATLNNTCSQDETIGCTKNADCQGLGAGKCGFAGHRDWRMPNVKELQSIVNYGLFQPSIDPVFGPTRPIDIPGPTYWSFTTDARNDQVAVVVDFDNGFIRDDGKAFGFYGLVGHPVRAVRNDQCQP